MLAGENDDLAVEDKLLLGEVHQGRDKFGKVSPEWLSGFGLQEHSLAAPKCKAAEPVPLGFVQPLITHRNLCDGFRLGRRVRGPDRQINVWKWLGQLISRKRAFGDLIFIFALPSVARSVLRHVRISMLNLLATATPVRASVWC